MDHHASLELPKYQLNRLEINHLSHQQRIDAKRLLAVHANIRLHLPIKSQSFRAGSRQTRVSDYDGISGELLFTDVVVLLAGWELVV